MLGRTLGFHMHSPQSPSHQLLALKLNLSSTDPERKRVLGSGFWEALVRAPNSSFEEQEKGIPKSTLGCDPIRSPTPHLSLACLQDK